MLKALASSTSGMNAQQLKLDIVANNLANSNTAGFKKSRAEFSELVSQEIDQLGIPASAGNVNRRVGGGVQVGQATQNFKPGGVIETGRPLDLAVEGEGFFRVILPGGEERYTRDGSFSLDKDGNVVTSAGYKLDGIQLNPGFDQVTVAPDGTVKTVDSSGATDAGQITLYRFTNMNGLRAEGENLFSYGQAAGQTIQGNPGSAGFGAVRQGYLETANVDLVEELANLIEAQRAYGFDARTVRTVDDMWSMANNLRK